jgi:hypothetical protein
MRCVEPRKRQSIAGESSCRNIFSLADREPAQVKTCKGRVLIGAPQGHLLQLAFKPIDAIRSALSITFGFALGMTAERAPNNNESGTI